MIIVSNTSPLSNLAAIGKLELFKQFYGQIFIPSAVYQELLNSGKTDPALLAIQSTDWIQCKSITNQFLSLDLQNSLDPGEAEAITLAVELQADRLIIDERRGRNQATKLGLPITGVLGVLIAAKKRGFITVVRPSLDDLKANGFWIQDNLYEEILQLVGE